MLFSARKVQIMILIKKMLTNVPTYLLLHLMREVDKVDGQKEMSGTESPRSSFHAHEQVRKGSKGKSFDTVLLDWWNETI
jgi:hypothetical protein